MSKRESKPTAPTQGRAARGLLMSIDELASQAEVSRRAVRYYIQRGLLPPPLGMGRGSHYSAEHLARLISLKEAQRGGRSLDEIAEELEHGAGVCYALSAPPESSHSAALGAPPPILNIERRLHVRCAEGVELSVRAGALSLERISALVSLIQEHISTSKTP
jgi:hypothetical protein